MRHDRFIALFFFVPPVQLVVNILPVYAASDNDTAIYSLAQRLRGEIQKAVLTTIDEKT